MNLKKRIRKSYAYRNRGFTLQFIRTNLQGCVRSICHSGMGPNDHTYVYFTDDSVIDFPPQSHPNMKKLWVGYTLDGNPKPEGIVVLLDPDCGKYLFFDSPHLSEPCFDQFMKSDHFWTSEIKNRKSVEFSDGMWTIRDSNGNAIVSMGDAAKLQTLQSRLPILDVKVRVQTPSAETLQEMNRSAEVANLKLELKRVQDQRDNYADRIRSLAGDVKELQGRLRKAGNERQNLESQLRTKDAQMGAATQIANQRSVHMQRMMEVVLTQVNGYKALEEFMDNLRSLGSLVDVLHGLHAPNDTVSIGARLLKATQQGKQLTANANDMYLALMGHAKAEGDTTFEVHMRTLNKAKNPSPPWVD